MSTIRVKVIARGRDAHSWRSQLPAIDPKRSEIQFIWQADATQYDWLVVIDDVSRELSASPEHLACADEHTLFVTTEPPSITRYGSAFCAQFAHVLTSQPPEALRHTNRIYSHTGNLWFNGHTYDDFRDKPFPQKNKQISTVCSSKQQKHTLHNDRYQFCQWLKQQLPALEIYGHGSRFIEKKYKALDRFRFHMAIENFVGPHHWTEKLADPFLSGAFPLYYGCPNLSDYFPAESFLFIDIFDRQATMDKIRMVLDNENFYTERLDALYEARRLVMEDYNLLNMVKRIVMKHFDASRAPSGRPLYSRKQMRIRAPGDLWEHVVAHTGRLLP